MRDLPRECRALPSRWWSGDFELGSTLLARDFKKKFCQRRGLTNPDDRLQREARSYANWAWSHGMDNCLRAPGYA
jgi:hypothetical protein